ncbi:hypothetical protein HNQ51_001879 [Inhella inkyongensis]|uniref:DUF3034 family protein n=1 Tax=Inhella inkyongensis TaxID=392593 RepID=A0A840S2M4_9BURK|nr:DUF3034 family protein [Inhella inkyongensis]MBB5204565.1 hypothetical protein [Inhella inkyongensis]
MLLLSLALCQSACAQGKLALTGGVASVDGAGGGGLSPWALTATPASEGEQGLAAFASHLKTRDYRLEVQGLAWVWDDRIELSLARQRLHTGSSLAALGLEGLVLQQQILGLKWKVAGDAVLDADRWMPQIAVGLLHKRTQAGALAPTLHGPLGADRQGNELYVAATKLWLDWGLLGNLTLRATRANQGGLLGFGGAQDRRWRLQPELSLAWLLSPRLAAGLEVRAKPNALERSVLGAGALREDDWFDVFLAWAPHKQVTLTVAAVDLGAIAPALRPKRQRGAYLSIQGSF